MTNFNFQIDDKAHTKNSEDKPQINWDSVAEELSNPEILNSEDVEGQNRVDESINNNQ